MLKSGDLAILLNPAGKRYLRNIHAGDEMHTSHGAICMDEVLAAGFGSTVETRQGMPYKIMRPTLKDLLKGIKRQTQIIYPKDIAYICLRLGVGNGTRIIEAGSGSGGLTLALSWFSGEKGHVYTYEAREEFYQLCGKNLAWAGVGHNVTQHLRDIKDGFEQTDADALFLDVREPWAYVGNVTKAVKPGAPLGFLVPTIEQVSELLKEFERQPIDDIEVVEILLRHWKTTPDRMRPEDRMVSHTGFLIFARYQESCPSWDANRKLGTRERKQEAARQNRLSSPEDHEEDPGEQLNFQADA